RNFVRTGCVAICRTTHPGSDVRRSPLRIGILPDRGSDKQQHINSDGGATMKVCDAMSRDVQVASPTQSIRDAARIMAKIDAGVLPVGENDRLVGVITDRDIAIRAVAEGKAHTTKVRDVMTQEVLY